MEDPKKREPAPQHDHDPQHAASAQDGRSEATPAPPGPISPSGWIFWAILLGILAALLYQQQWETREELPSWAAFRTMVREDGVVEGTVVLRNNRIESVLKPDFTFEDVKEETGEELPVYVAIDQQNRDFYLARLEELDVAWRDETSEVMWPTLLLMFSPLLLLLLLGAWAVSRARRMSESGPAGMFGQFARSQHRVASKDSVTVTLDDVAGVEDAKAEVDELIDFLKHFQRFQDMGARPPRGVLLLGPPGCGKTLLARAIAGEADVPFFSISGSDFMEMFVGVGASRVRDLFAQAKRSAPCIIFLDEIDSVGRKRGGQMNIGGDHGEREQTLNAILSEMDGFEPSDQVMVIAATNRPDVLDPALTRRGRFDRPVTIPLPDVRGRHGILRIHAKQVRLGDDVDLEQVARSTPMFSGADLAALVNEAAILAVVKGDRRVRMDSLREARDKVRFGRAMKDRIIEDEQRVTIAYHEAGHAVVQVMLEHADPIEKVTIVPRGRALGGTFALPEKDRYNLGRKYLDATMRVACAGRISEAEQSGDISSGAADDIKRVTAMARKMVLEWGMSETLGFVQYVDEEEAPSRISMQERSERIAAEADEAVRRTVGEAYHEAEQIIQQNWDAVVALAEALLEKESLLADEVHRLVTGKSGSETPHQAAAE